MMYKQGHSNIIKPDMILGFSCFLVCFSEPRLLESQFSEPMFNSPSTLSFSHKDTLSQIVDGKFNYNGTGKEAKWDLADYSL